MVSLHQHVVAAAQVNSAAEKFALFGSVHLSILLATVALPFAMSRWTQRGARPRLARGLAFALSAVLLLNYAFIFYWSIHMGRLTHWPSALPMQLCDWATIVVIAALLWRRQQAYELAYFWGLSGTVQALLTPNVSTPITDPLVLSFFIGHSGIVVGVLFLTWGLDLRPLPGAVLRAWLWTQLYLATAALANWLFGLNFGFLAAKPPRASLLDWFGPWPWYILTLEVVGVVAFTIFYLPFWVADRARAAAH